MKLLPVHGKNWGIISENIPGKTPLQVRNYFQNHSVELGLPAIAARADKPPRGAGNPHKPNEGTPLTPTANTLPRSLQLLKPGATTPGVASPLSNVLALAEGALDDPPPYAATATYPQQAPVRSQSFGETVPQTSLPSIGELMRTSQIVGWREHHPATQSVVPQPSATDNSSTSNHTSRPW